MHPGGRPERDLSKDPRAGAPAEPTLRKVSCPSCAGAIDLRLPKGRFAVCGHCGSDLDLRKAAPELLLKRTSPQPSPPGWGGLTVGARGLLHGKAATVAGRVRYKAGDWSESWSWDEWFLAYDDGNVAYLQDDEGSLTLFRPFVPAHAVAPSELRAGNYAKLDHGSPAMIEEVAEARIVFSEGEVPFVPDPTKAIGYADLVSDAYTYSVEWTGDEVEFWRGVRVPKQLMASGFALRAPPGGDGGDDDDHDEEEWLANQPPLVKAMILLAILAVVMFIFWDELDDDDRNRNRHWGGGHGVYRSSGFGGGK